MPKLNMTVRLSQFAQPFMLAAIDLLKAVRLAEDADEDVPEEIRDAARAFEQTIDEGHGDF